MALWQPLSTAFLTDFFGELAAALPTDLTRIVAELQASYLAHLPKNKEKLLYYEGNLSLASVNLGIALPLGYAGLNIACAWGAKAVDALAARSRFDGFVGDNGDEAEAVRQIVERNNLIYQYGKACRDELTFGCTFATLSKDANGAAKIRFHSPLSAAGKWSGGKERLEYGLAVIATEESDGLVVATVVNIYTDKETFVCTRNAVGRWGVESFPHPLGRPLMIPLVWNATSLKPLGQSRIKARERSLIDGYVRTLANASIALEYATTPQKYILGVTDKQYDAIVGDKFRQYVGSILAATTNPETGQNPTYGQLPQGNIQPHVEQLRLLATQYSAATCLPVSDTGVINDANPTSADAIEAQEKSLLDLAKDLNGGNGAALRQIILMAEALEAGTTVEKLSQEQKDVIAFFLDPSNPPVSVTADAAIKIATARPDFALTDVFLEMLGFSRANIRRIKSQEESARGMAVFEGLVDEEEVE